MKIVINRCIGFFDVSNEALIRLVERGSPIAVSLPTDEDEYERWHGKRGRFSIPLRDGFFISEVIAGVLRDGVRYALGHETPRNHPDLVAIVEEMGEEANIPGWSKLVIVTIPDGVDWYILEEHHDCCECNGNGMESIHEVHRIWTE